MFKVLLISPPVFDFYFTPARCEPLGLLYIRESLKQLDDVDVLIYDSLLSGKKKEQLWPEEFNHLRNIYKKDLSAFSLFSSYKRFGDSFNKITAFIEKEKPSIIAISSMFTPYHDDVENLIKEIKKNFNIEIAVGGWAVEAEQENLFKKSSADYFLLGAGENSLTDLVKARKKGNNVSEVQGIIYRKDDKVFKNPPRRLEKDSFELFPERAGSYYFKRKKISRMTVSKGCVFKCEFCAIHRQNKFMCRSLDSVEREMQYLAENGSEIINFEDDNLFFDKIWNKGFIELLSKFNKKYGITYTAMNGITAANLAPIVEEVIDAGFIEFNLSLVSGNKEIAEKIHRPLFAESIEKIADAAKGKVDTLVFLILGLPDATISAILSDIFFLAALPVRIGVSPLYLLPGIDIFEKMGIPEKKRLCRGSALYRFGENFTREDIFSLWKFVRMINYIKEKPFCDKTDDNYEFFSKSLKEKVWYLKKEDGKWEKYLPFEIDLPHQVTICKLDGTKEDIVFY